MVFIHIKNNITGAAGRYRSESREAKLHEGIDSGKLSDRDLQDITRSGDKSLLMHADRKTNELYQKKKYFDNQYGKDVWDGKDKEGNLYKNLNTNFKMDGDN